MCEHWMALLLGCTPVLTYSVNGTRSITAPVCRVEMVLLVSIMV